MTAAAMPVASVLEAAAGVADAVVEIGGRTVRLTNLDRILWPLTGTTKRDVLAYVLKVAPVLLPYLRGRAVMLWRFPEGVDGPGWFQAQCRGRPEWVRTQSIASRRGEVLEYCLVEEPATLAWLANLGTIELHPHLWRVDRPAEPDAMIVDLDPGPPAGRAACARVALIVREHLSMAGLSPVVKTSGRLGLHVVAPLTAGHSFETTKTFARELAQQLEASEPGLVIASSSRVDRAGRVYLDWVQNDRNRQLVAPYSLRAAPLPAVSMPVRWDEVTAAAAGEPEARAIFRSSPERVLTRIDELGDLWAGAPAGRLAAR
jgi:bifunctional non-homologous end joining protein LigD